MTDKNFLVSGTTAISSTVHSLLNLPKRKFYNAVYFNDNQYRHEIANHYRDFKLKQRLRQRKKAINFYGCGKVVATNDFALDYQQELPMAVYVFPSFNTIYKPRRHQKICEQRTPVLTYNDTINRLKNAADDTELLKKLAGKHLERSKHQHQCKKCSNVTVTTKCQTANQLQQSRRRSLAKLETVDYYFRQQPQKLPVKTNESIKISLARENQHWEGNNNDTCDGIVVDDTLKYYLQLCTNFYRKGYLKNIKYLENLGERNLLRRKRHTKPQQQQQQQQKLIFRSIDDLSNTTTSSLKTKHIPEASCDRNQIPINQNNPILWHENKLEVNEFPSNKHRNTNCGIRINIKPQTFNSDQQNFKNKKIHGKNKACDKSKDFNSMNGYLNVNFEYMQLLQQEQEQQHQLQSAKLLYHNTNTINHNYSEKVLLVDNLVDNFKELDIQENCTNLPRITLTDYSQNYPNELEANIQTQTVIQANRNHLHSYLLKQSSLDCSQLGIPLETHYHSEARPPLT